MSRKMKVLMIGVASAADAPVTCSIELMNNSENSRACVHSDDEAFHPIFTQHHRFVFRFLYGMVGDHGLAEELTQETFMRAYKNISTLRGESKISTWLCGIAKNVALNALRRRNREVSSVEMDDHTVTNLVDGDAVGPGDGSQRSRAGRGRRSGRAERFTNS
jgi:DNA-directed RNA polymerase specialized sigma24 family protein